MAKPHLINKEQNKINQINRLENMSTRTESHGNFELTYEEIQKKAYQLHEQRGGDHLENWLDAERTLKQERIRR